MTEAEASKHRSAEREEELDSQKATQNSAENPLKKMGYLSSNDTNLERDLKRQRTDDSSSSRTKKQPTFQADDWMAAGKNYIDLAQELSKDDTSSFWIYLTLIRSKLLNNGLEWYWTEKSYFEWA